MKPLPFLFLITVFTAQAHAGIQEIVSLIWSPTAHRSPCEPIDHLNQLLLFLRRLVPNFHNVIEQHRVTSHVGDGGLFSLQERLGLRVTP